MSRQGRPGHGATAAGAALLLATAVGLWVAATAGRPQTTDAPGPEPPPPTTAELVRELTPMVARRVEALRGLRFDEVPVPRVITAERFAAISARRADPSAADRRELADAESAARMLGLMAPGEQAEALLEGAPDLAAAAWDSRRDRLYVIADAARGSPALVEFLLAHELDHALEDQRFGLPRLEGVSDDEALAGLALVEGSATATMAAYAARHLSPLALAAGASGLDSGTDEVPRFVVEQLTWAYLRGAAFVNALTGDGSDWGPVDRALADRPPASTEQVLHPAAFRADERPLAVEPGTGALRAAGWTPLYRAVNGELATAQLLRLGVPSAAARRAASGWGGDSLVILGRGSAGTDCGRSCGRRRVLVLEWAWDSRADAIEFERTLPAYLIAGLGASPRGELWRLDPGWAASATAGRTVRLALAPTRALAAVAAAPR